MKKYLLLILSLALSGLSAFAQTQTAYDALIASSSELSGTARFMSVGGAMGALGGDASTIFYNPAGIGIYRSSELTISGNVHWDNSKLYNSNSTYSSENRTTKIALQHVAYVGTWVFEDNNTLLNFNLGVAYNQNKKFSRSGEYHGNQPHSYTQWIAAMTDNIPVGKIANSDTDWYTNPAYKDPSIPWSSVIAFDSYLTDTKYLDKDDIYTSLYDWSGSKSINQEISFTEYGSANNFALSFAGNIKNIIYWGMTFECDLTTYDKTTVIRETFADGSVYNLMNTYMLEATGFTYKIGLIAKPTSWLRIGAAFHTPTVYSMHDASLLSQCDYNVYDISGQHRIGVNETPSIVTGRTSKLTGPLKAMGSLGFVIGKFGFIGIDYQYDNTSAINGNDGQIQDQYANDLKDRHTIRAGAEVKPIENLSLRIGGGYSTPSMSENMSRGYYYNDMRTDTDYYNEKDSYNVTTGIGYRFGRHSIDLAYVWQVNTADYYPYSPSYTKKDGSQFQLDNFEPIELRSVRNQLILTYNVRF